MRSPHLPRIRPTAAAMAVVLLGAATSAAQSQAPTDPQIAHIAVTANQLDITAAEQALAKSENEEVRAFAETMIRDHRAVIGQASALAERLGVTPLDNETSRSLTESAAAARERLADLDGEAFDLAYMENEVAYHDAVISAVEDTLIPNTSNQELEELLQAVVPALEAHRDHAARLVREIGTR